MSLTAEFRGPGVKHQFEDSGDDYDMDLQNNGRGRIIFLGDGTEVLTEGDEEEDEKDVEMQGNHAEPAKVDGARNEREETPEPEPQKAVSPQHVAKSAMGNDSNQDNASEGDDEGSVGASKNSPAITTIPESALPDKLVPPPSAQEK